MEKVQRRLVRALSDVRGATYEEKLRDAGLTTLQERRERGDLIETYKTLRGFNRVKVENWFTMESESARATRRTASVTEEGVVRKEYVVVEELARLEIRRNFFTVRAAKAWNRLPEEVKQQNSINSFKNALDRWKEGNPPQDRDAEEER